MIPYFQITEKKKKKSPANYGGAETAMEWEVIESAVCTQYAQCIKGPRDCGIGSEPLQKAMCKLGELPPTQDGNSA